MTDKIKPIICQILKKQKLTIKTLYQGAFSLYLDYYPIHFA
jgi:hypothetical protein